MSPSAAPGTVAAFLEEIGRRRANFAAVLEGLATIRWEEEERALCFEPNDRLGAESLARANNREQVEAAAEKVFGRGARVRVLPARAAERPPTAAVRVAEAKKVELLENPQVQAVLEMFGGEVSAVGSDDEKEEEDR
ncbi:MAG: hypothetical protein R2862_01930 [Thermoanaerobaculia bacterium]